MKRVARWAGIGLAVVVISVVVLGVRCDRPAAEVEARWAKPPSKFLEVDGLRIHYRDRGTGPAIVLLHGSNSSLFTWEPWVADLSRDHRVITLDLPGHGLTGPDPRARYSSMGMASVVDAFVSALGVDRFTLMGNSMGGGVAWRYTILHPDKVERLVLVDAAGLPREEPPPFGFRMFRSPVLGRLVRWISPHPLIAKSVRDTRADPRTVTDEQIALYEDILLRAGNREATRQRFGIDDADGLVARLGEIHVPTLILWGAGDPWILPKYAERFHAAIPGSRLVMLPGLGHLPMEENPQRSLVPLRQFLAEPAR
jgi:pimeloyl-ACP methyl ester carboxylesterase